MTKLILTRHGHVEGIDPARFRGRTDLPLTELGWIQAKAVASRIAALWAPVAVFTSPMSRSAATADAIAEACHVRRHVLEDLNDLDYGSWNGRPMRRFLALGRISSRPRNPRLILSDFPTAIRSRIWLRAPPMPCGSSSLAAGRRRWCSSAMTASIAHCSFSFSISRYPHIGGLRRHLARSTKSTSWTAIFTCKESMKPAI
jgi:hypothetical protein